MEGKSRNIGSNNIIFRTISFLLSSSFEKNLLTTAQFQSNFQLLKEREKGRSSLCIYIYKYHGAISRVNLRIAVIQRKLLQLHREAGVSLALYPFSRHIYSFIIVVIIHFYYPPLPLISFELTPRKVNITSPAGDYASRL